MILRHIILTPCNLGFGSGYGDVFDDKFAYNVFFVSYYLSKSIRKYKIETDSSYNTLCCYINKGKESCFIEEYDKSLTVSLHVGEKEIEWYLNMNTEQERFEFYLGLLEKAYTIAASYKREFPERALLDLHQQFRNENYMCSFLFKKKTIRDFSIKICLNHVCSSYDYRLMLTVNDLHGNKLSEDYIYRTYPDSIFFWKTVRHLVITDHLLLITDFLDKPQFECQLAELARGIIRSVCLSENTRKYIYSEETKAKFDALKWDTTGDMTKNTIKP